MIELILLEKGRYQGSCKIVITILSKLLIVEPNNEDYKMISASFEWQFLYHYKTLFVLADFNFKNFALVFDNDKKCKKVFDIICKNKNALEDTSSQKQSVQDIILIPFIKEIEENGIMDLRIIEIAKEWTKNSRKSVTKIFKSSEFTLVYFKADKIRRKRLLLFTSTEKSHCYEFRQSYKSNKYSCIGCCEKNRKFTIKIKKNKVGNDCIKQCGFRHVCIPKIYDHQKYIQIEILKKPKYKIFEKCFQNNRSLMVIFDSDDDKLCYEFVEGGYHRWYCRECKSVKAILRNEIPENEYLELDDIFHSCKKQEYKEEKYQQYKSFVLSEDFEIHTSMKNDVERKTLIIFDEKDRKLCRIYSYTPKENRFICRKCEYQKKNVTAKLHQNSEGEEYIILSNEKHVCELEPYRIEKQITLQPQDFKIIENTLTAIPKLFIFDEKDKKLCYVFSPVFKSPNNFYYCLRCKNVRKITSVQLCIDKNGNRNVLMSDKLNHSCSPQKFDPKVFEVKKLLHHSEYYFFADKEFPKFIYAAIKHPADKTLCYKFLLKRSNHTFVCCECEKKGKRTPKKLLQNENANPYFYETFEEHICQPIKIESLQKPAFKILKDDEINLERNSRIKKKPVEKDKSKIIEMPNFELHPNKNGVPDQKIIIFHPNDRDLRWEFPMMNKCFRCRECKLLKNHNVFAKLYSKKNGEKYVILGNQKHLCEPIKLEKEKIIESSNFLLFDKKDETKTAKLLIFTSPSKELCYKFVYQKANKQFQCFYCFGKKRIHVSAKICQNSDGTEYVQLGNKAHVCEPQKYVPERKDLVQKSNSKIIPASFFELQCNTKGEPNKAVIVFTSEKKDFIYRYAFKSETCFRCSSCANRRHYTSVNLCENENGEKFLECSSKDHVCAPTKYFLKKNKK